MVSMGTQASRFSTMAEAEPAMEEKTPRQANVGMAERIVLGTVGGLLVGRALAHPTLPRMVCGAMGAALLYRSVSGYCPAYQSLGIDTARRGQAKPQDYYRNGIHVEMAYTIMRPAEELFQYWRNFANLPTFMTHLKEVSIIDEHRSRWVARGPAGKSISWEAEIINEEPGRLIAWRSLANADVDNAGSIRFVAAPGNRGTEVRVNIEYIPPAGQIGRTIAWMFGEEPRQQIQEDLRRFKRLMETGEIPTTQGQPRGKCAMGS